MLLSQRGEAQTRETAFSPQPNNHVYALALQPDGKILVGGSFTILDGVERNIVGRLNPDGSYDDSFTPNSPSDGKVYTLAVQPDEKVIVGGDFDAMSGSASNLKRLGPTGYADPGFNAYPDSWVLAVAIQPDGKILLGGSFQHVGTNDVLLLTRLETNGTLDASFHAEVLGYAVHTLLIQPDGKIVVGGDFNHLNGQARANIGRLNADGTTDTTFDPTADDVVRTLAIQPDGKILAGGDFALIAGHAASRLARLKTDGTWDSSFSQGANNATQIFSILVQPDGKILVGGAFTTMAGAARNRLARLQPSGAIDSSFNPNVGGGAANYLMALALQPDGKIVLGGKFTSVGVQNFTYLARIHAGGDVESGFSPMVVHGSVFVMAQQADEKILAGGSYTSLVGQTRYRIGRLLPNGNLDTNSTPFNSRVYGEVNDVVVQADNKILLGGTFTNVAGYTRNRIARLHANGTVDAGFNPNANATVWTLAIQPDGAILAGGDFTTLNAVSRIRIGRITTNGAVDTAFIPGSGANNAVLEMAVQPDGKIVVGGVFTNLGGYVRSRIGRLYANGSVDPTFNLPSSGANGAIGALALQPDGKIVVGGSFTILAGETRNRIGRLNTNGTLDTAFSRGGEPDGDVGQLALTTDGRVLIAGGFSTVNGLPRRGMARLNTNGTLDASFNAGLTEATRCFVVQADGRIPVSDLDLYFAKSLYRLVVTNAVSQQLVLGEKNDTVSWMRSGAAPEVYHVVFEQSLNGTTFTPLGTPQRIDGGWQLAGLSLTPEQNLWIKARSLYPAVEMVWNVYPQRPATAYNPGMLLLLFDE